jgi:hypothetical protein
MRLCEEIKNFMQREAILSVDGQEILSFGRQSRRARSSASRRFSSALTGLQIAIHAGASSKATSDRLLRDPASARSVVRIFRRRHGREESVNKLTLGARWSAYDAHG